jgi:hypothetical protein
MQKGDTRAAVEVLKLRGYYFADAEQALDDVRVPTTTDELRKLSMEAL